MRIVFLFLVCVASMAQTSDPAFDAASIRPSPPLDTSRGQFNFGPGGGPGAADPALYTCHFCTVSQLIAQAYGLPEYRIFSARGISDERFDVIARVPAGATREQLRVMLQHLLAERFKLAVHHESREMQTFRLVVGRSGAKLTTHVEDPPAPADRQVDSGNRPRRVTYKSKGKTMTDFARAIAGQLRRPVTDATGLTGKYDFELSWAPDDSPDGPTLISAIQSLGLNLESQKGPVEVVVIDRVEKSPTEN